jgi:signal peptidase II
MIATSATQPRHLEPRSLAVSTARRKAWLVNVSLLVLALDQWTKLAIERKLDFTDTVSVIPGLLNLIHVTNTGVAFGLFQTDGHQGGTILLTLLGFIALTAVAIFFYRAAPEERLLQWALALVQGGALGNLADRMTRGAVTDFIDVFAGSYHFHTFNVADSAISIGIVLLALDSLRPRRAEAPATGQHDAPSSLSG